MPPRWLAGALVAASIALLTTADALNPAFDWVAEPVSRHVHDPHGWLVPLGIACAAAATLAGLLVLRRYLRDDRSRGTRGGLAFLGAAVVALVVCALVPADAVGYRQASWRELVHGGAGWIALLGFPFAAFALRPRLRAWWLTALASAAGACALGIVVIWLRLTQTWDAFPVGAHHTVFGLDERAAMYLAFCWLASASWCAGGRAEAATPSDRPR